MLPLDDVNDAVERPPAAQAQRRDRRGEVILHVPALVDLVYREIPADLKRWAAFSLEAHLIKLAEDGRAQGADGRWQLVATAAV